MRGGRIPRRGVLVLVAALAAFGLAACGGDEEATDGGDGGAETTVAVTLQEFAVIPAQDSAPAESVTLEATNEGPDDPHELVAALAAFGLAACGGDEEATDGGDGGAETTVAVTLQEFAVIPAQDSAPAESVTLEATNEGPDDPHELVVIRTDLAPDALPTDENGAVDEAGEGIDVIGEIEELPVGETQSATFELEAGAYALICNIYEEAEDEAHYQLGMRTPFTVE